MMKNYRILQLTIITVTMIFISIYIVVWEPECIFRRPSYRDALSHLYQSKIYAHGPYRTPPSLNRNLVTILTRKISPDFIARLKMFDSNFDDNFTTNLLIMHGDEMTHNDFTQVAESVQRQVLFLNVGDAFILFPETFNPCRTKSTWRTKGKWNYQLMIRFWFKIIFELPQLQYYEYILRLDDDSKLTGKWINVFDEMRAKNAVYFANTVDQDFEGTLRGTMNLKPVVLNYVRENNMTAKQTNMFQDAFHHNMVRTYFNNFEVTNVAFFQQPKVRHWVNAIDQTHGIFKYRWGDAILRYLTIALFAEKHQILHRLDYALSYCHKC